MCIPLSNDNLGRLPRAIKTPKYDRSELTPGIVHIGLGNFHRAHQAWYLHRLFEQGLNLDWGIIGAGVRPYDEKMRLKLKAQDYLTTLIELDPSGVSAEVIGSMIDYVPLQKNNGALINAMADPAIRIVAMTVTEGGYYIDQATKEFDEQHEDIQHDAQHPQHPITAFGAIVAALKLRRDSGIGPLTGLSCDNILGNGNVLRQTVVSLAKLTDRALADWIETQCTFPNSMVDCIVPATGDKERALAKELGIDDAAPVTHESFRQWVIEDKFCAGRPEWDRVGATFSQDVHGYETQKIRILNAGHQIIANLAEILNIDTIAMAMAHPQIRAFFHKVQRYEIIPHVVPVPNMTPMQYVDLIGGRFANPKIEDTSRRVAFDGSSRHPGFIIPTIRDGLRSGAQVDGLALVEAVWARMCNGHREDGSLIQPNDPNWEELNQRAHKAQEQPRLWLEMHHIYGELSHQPSFADPFEYWLSSLYSDGVEATLNEYLDGYCPDAKRAEG